MSPAERIIHKLGGVRTAARLLGKPPSTVQDWKRAGLIPAKHQATILRRAMEAGVTLAAEDFIELGASPTPQQPPEAA